MLAALQRNRVVREALIFLAFCGFTAVLTWPYVLHLRDAVADTGDPYLVSWILWWDDHQTFTDPLNLFHANLFYPLRYTLAFSENSYGIALPFFPLYALGFRPLTVHAIALFLGFATSGYAAFRLGRTLTGSTGAGWIAGIAFAFVPLRFNMLSHLQYLFSMWIPLIFEALVLFARDRSRKRAIWLGVAFFMSGLTCVTWFAFSLVPLAVCAAILLTRYGIWRDRAFWWRGTTAVGLAGIALLPFLLPYQFVAKLYNFRRSVDEVKDGSARVVHWLAVEGRNRFWRGLGTNAPGRFKLFPGLLPLLLALAAVLTASSARAVQTFHLRSNALLSPFPPDAAATTQQIDVYVHDNEDALIGSFTSGLLAADVIAGGASAAVFLGTGQNGMDGCAHVTVNLVRLSTSATVATGTVLTSLVARRQVTGPVNVPLTIGASPLAATSERFVLQLRVTNSCGSARTVSLLYDSPGRDGRIDITPPTTTTTTLGTAPTTTTTVPWSCLDSASGLGAVQCRLELIDGILRNAVPASQRAARFDRRLIGRVEHSLAVVHAAELQGATRRRVRRLRRQLGNLGRAIQHGQVQGLVGADVAARVDPLIIGTMSALSAVTTVR